MLTPKRATEVHNAQKQFPYFGNYRRFMTPEEITHVEQLWRDATLENWSITD
jgi:hypothetical protein